MPSRGVCPSDTFVHSVKTNKDIYEIFSPSGSPAMLDFPFQTAWQHSDGNPPNGGLECRWGRLKSRFKRISGFAINNCCILVCILQSATGYLFTAGIGRPSVTRCTHSWSSVNRVYDSKARRHAEDNRTELNCTHW